MPSSSGPVSESSAPAAFPAAIGRYKPVSVLGHGGSGVVYRAVHMDTGASAALKLGIDLREDVLSSVRREIHAVRQLRHPGVVTIYDDGTHDGLPWFAMELLEGATLRTRFRRATAPTLSLRGDELGDVLRLFERICEPLAYIHEHGIVHADLKPENIFIRSDGHPVLVDFGLFFPFASRGRETLIAGGTVGGTACYLAPERIRGELLDARADIYALGCILYEVIAGRPPFDGPWALQDHLDTAPTPLRDVAAETPEWLERLVSEMLHKDRRRRIGYARIPAARIRQALGEPIAADATGAAAPYLYQPTFIGRSAALRELRQLVQSARAGRGGVAFIGGESGIGKTRLAMEVATQAVVQGFRVVNSSCSSLQAVAADGKLAGVALHAFLPLLQALADRCRSGGAETTERLLAERLPILAAYSELFRDLPSPRAERGERPKDVSPEAETERLQRAIIGSVQAFATIEAPLLVVIDDVQWADEPSLALLRAFVAADLGGTPIVVLATHRTEEVDEPLARLLAAKHVARHVLGRFERDDVRQLVEEMLALPSPPEAFVGMLAEHTEGNPFFLSEYLRLAASESMLRLDATGAWTLGADKRGAAAAAFDLPIPGTLQSLIRMRLDRLSQGSLEVARMASILGAGFDERLLGAVSHMSDAELTDVVADLERRRILVRGDAGRIAFDHGTIREVTYGSIAASRRGELHERAARGIERCYDEREIAQLHYASLAHHWLRAVERESAPDDVVAKAVAAAENAAQRATAGFANLEAVHFYEQALRLDRDREDDADRRQRHARWERGLGEAFFRLGRVQEAPRHLERALQLSGVRVPTGPLRVAGALAREVARQGLVQITRRPIAVGARRDEHDAAERQEAARLSEALGLVWFINLDNARAVWANLRALNLAEARGPCAELVNASAMVGLCASTALGQRVAQRYFDRGLDVARAIDDQFGLGRVLYTRALVLTGQARWSDAEADFDGARRTFEDIGDLRWRDSALMSTSVLRYTHGHFHACVPAFEQARRSTIERTDVQGQAWATNGCAGAYLALGRLQDSLEAIDEVEQLLSGNLTSLDRGATITYLGCRAAALSRRGDDERAVAAALETGRLIHESPVMIYYTLAGYALAAEALFRAIARRPSDELDEPVSRLVRDLVWFSRSFPVARPQASLWNGFLQRRRGRLRAARTSWLRAARWGERLDMRYDGGIAHLCLARHAEGDGVARERHERAAAESLRSIGLAIGDVEPVIRFETPRARAAT